MWNDTCRLNTTFGGINLPHIIQENQLLMAGGNNSTSVYLDKMVFE